MSIRVARYTHVGEREIEREIERETERKHESEWVGNKEGRQTRCIYGLLLGRVGGGRASFHKRKLGGSWER